MCKERLRYTLTERCLIRVDGRGGLGRKEQLNRPFGYSARYWTGTSFAIEALLKGELCHLRSPQLQARSSPMPRKRKSIAIRFFHRSHNTVHFGGVFALKQWIISSLKHDTVPRVNNLYCFYVKNPPKRIALWDRENSQ